MAMHTIANSSDHSVRVRKEGCNGSEPASTLLTAEPARGTDPVSDFGVFVERLFPTAGRRDQIPGLGPTAYGFELDVEEQQT